MYEAQKFDHLLGIEGLSEGLLKAHFGLYEGYVKNTNLVLDELKKVETGTPPFAELKRRFGWEFDGMRLHELYFGNLMKGGSPASTRGDHLSTRGGKLDEAEALKKKIEEDFGSAENWEKDFRGVLSMRGIGWAVFYYDTEGDRLFNTWIGEHDGGHLAGCVPLLVIDAFEHAYIADYGTKRLDYIEAVMKILCWHVVGARFAQAKA